MDRWVFGIKMLDLVLYIHIVKSVGLHSTVYDCNMFTQSLVGFVTISAKECTLMCSSFW